MRAGWRNKVMVATGLLACLASPIWGDESEEFFEKKIRPILVGRCQKCHSAGNAENDLRLDSRPQMLLGGHRGAAIVPGQPSESLIMRAVRRESDDLAMPPDEPLTDEQITALDAWIRDGASWPGLEHLAAATRADPSGHWAYQPLQDADPPVVEQPLWMESAIDRFVRNRQIEAGCQPVELAEPAALLRRIYFDLIGLPPTAEETRAFLRHASDDHYRAMVDALLESPHYGERWGRHWLDVSFAMPTPLDAIQICRFAKPTCIVTM